MVTEAKERYSRKDTLGGFSGVGGRKSRRAFHNERSSQYVVTRRLTLPRPRARRVDNRFREGATAVVLPPLWTMFERRRHSGNQVDSQSAYFPHHDRSPTFLYDGNRSFSDRALACATRDEVQILRVSASFCSIGPASENLVLRLFASHIFLYNVRLAKRYIIITNFFTNIIDVHYQLKISLMKWEIVFICEYRDI